MHTCSFNTAAEPSTGPDGCQSVRKYATTNVVMSSRRVADKDAAHSIDMPCMVRTMTPRTVSICHAWYEQERRAQHGYASHT